MANILLSPGVLQREIDASFIAEQPPVIGAAIIGPTVRGPVNVPVSVTSYTDFVDRFGDVLESGSGIYSYFTSIAAYNYFNNNGQSLLVVRVANEEGGVYTSATASIPTGSGTTGDSPFAFTLATISQGSLMNNSGSVDSRGALVSGSINNIRVQITSPDTGSGTFSLFVRRGDDTTKNNIVLETFANLSLDPLASNYISKVIGDYSFETSNIDGVATLQVNGTYPNKSRYIRVQSVDSPTPQYLVGGVANPIYTGSIPVASSGGIAIGFGGASGEVMAGAKFYETAGDDANNTQGVSGSDYQKAIDLLASPTDFQFNAIFTPGLTYGAHKAQMNDVIENTQDRGDNIYVVDLIKYGQTSSAAVTAQANDIDSSYAAAYWPWVQTLDPATKKYVWVPASTMIGGVYAYNDSVSEPWFAPAGINRGGLSTVTRAEIKLPQATRDTLYQGKVNPIATFPGQGVVVYGQKTLQTAASALDRVNVRRLMIALKGFIGQIANGLVFQQNTAATRNSFLAQVNPYLESVQQRQGLFAFKVVMDEAINNPAVIDRNELVGQIYLQPTKTAEFIYLNFTITPTGATFPA
jgi:hypothetical protein